MSWWILILLKHFSFEGEINMEQSLKYYTQKTPKLDNEIIYSVVIICMTIMISVLVVTLGSGVLGVGILFSHCPSVCLSLHFGYIAGVI